LVWHFEGEKVKELRSYWDAADLLRQMGMIPEATSLPIENG
jgi:ketosteroid isomerase-like protein